MAGLYIHIPFCASRCAYCDFYRGIGVGSIEPFVEALKREMAARSQLSTFNFPLSTIYVGGGTPSLLSPAQLRGVLDTAAGLWDCTALREVTIEANPEDVTDEWLAGLAEFKSAAAVAADRLSLGVQSFDDGLLRTMNRRHDAARAREAVRAAQRAGFANITIDLIYGLPGMTRRQWESSLDEATALGVQHISAYHLTIEPGTALGKKAARGKLPHVPESESEWQFETLRERLLTAGFEHYEISNFAIPGRRAVHNSAYWSGAPYLGVGPSAHSFDGARRREWVVADLEKYLSAGPQYGGETLTETELLNERIMTSLRTAEGIDRDELEQRFGPGPAQEFDRRAKWLLDRGLLHRKGEKIAIPAEKFLLSDYVISRLFAPEG